MMLTYDGELQIFENSRFQDLRALQYNESSLFSYFFLKLLNLLYVGGNRQGKGSKTF